MRIDMAYEGDDGFGNERVSLAWYIEKILFVMGVFYGTQGGLVHIDIYEDGIHVELMGNIDGNTMTGTWSLEIPTETVPVVCNFLLHRQ